MNVLTDVLKVVGTVFLVGVIFLAGIYIGVGLAYLFGMLLAILPFVSDWLTAGLPISKAQLPGIVAWLAVAGLFLGGGAKAASKWSEEE